MKFLIAFAVVAAVAVAVPVHRELITPGLAGPTPVVDENGSPIAIGPAILDLSPISVGPAIVESNPISVGPAIIDFPLPDGGFVTADEPTAVIPSPVIQPSPVVIGEIPAGATPLVQIIVNVNAPESAVVAPTPADNAVVEEEYIPGPVNVVDHVIAPESVIEPVQVVAPVLPGPVNVVDNVVVEPVQVVAPVVPGPVNVVDNVVVEPVQVAQPIIVEPIVVGTPVIPAPAVVIPDTLN